MFFPFHSNPKILDLSCKRFLSFWVSMGREKALSHKYSHLLKTIFPVSKSQSKSLCSKCVVTLGNFSAAGILYKS